MQNPTVKVLSTLTANRVEHLLMVGQACVFYGAAQFSRDADIAVVAESFVWPISATQSNEATNPTFSQTLGNLQ
jgi:hypothetical protein